MSLVVRWIRDEDINNEQEYQQEPHCLQRFEHIHDSDLGDKHDNKEER